MKKNINLHNNLSSFYKKFFPPLSLVMLATLGGGLALSSLTDSYDLTPVSAEPENHVEYNSYIFNDHTSSLDILVGIETRTYFTYDEGSYVVVSYDYNVSYSFRYVNSYYVGQTGWVNSNAMPQNISTYTYDDMRGYEVLFVADEADGIDDWYVKIYTNTSIYCFTQQVAIPYSTSFDNGYITYIGYEQGLIDIGKDIGFSQGEEYGYTDGYNDGLNANFNENAFAILLGSIFNAPVYIFRNAFDFELFGINIASLIGVLLTIGVVVLAISIFKGKE